MALEQIQIKHNTKEWLAFRRSGIGGSDAAAILGLSPFKTNVEVWEEKVGQRISEDLSDVAAVKYGTASEECLARLFALDFPEYNLEINKEIVYRRGFMFASLDGELTDLNGDRGIYEGKTSAVYSFQGMERWNNRVPENYYVQVLHYLIVTGWNYAWIKAQIKQTGGNRRLEIITRHYLFQREALKDDMKYLFLKEKEFWGYVERQERPPLILPDIRK